MRRQELGSTGLAENRARQRAAMARAVVVQSGNRQCHRRPERMHHREICDSALHHLQWQRPISVDAMWLIKRNSVLQGTLVIKSRTLSGETSVNQMTVYSEFLMLW